MSDEEPCTCGDEDCPSCYPGGKYQKDIERAECLADQERDDRCERND